MGLSDVSFLQGYEYLQTLDLSGNNLTDISCLGVMRYLVRLNVSNNKLQKVVGFEPPPFNLQEIDFSRNQIQEIGDLSAHRFLKAVCLDRNLIHEISGLSQCWHLTHLSIAQNGISVIENIDNLPIKYLDLSSNRIRSLSGIESLLSLEELKLSHNSIETLCGIHAGHKYLRRLDLESNQIDDPDEINQLQCLPFLTELVLKRNPLTVAPALTSTPTAVATAAGGDVAALGIGIGSYRLSTAFKLQALTVLDGLPLSYEEKVAAINMYDPPPCVVASVQHAVMVQKQARLYAKIKAEDLMRATRLRPIVLCGPNGVGKRTLTARLLKEFPHIYGLSVSHTTRKPRPGEELGVHYHFVSKPEMERMVEEGKFIEVVTLFGVMYGTSMDAIDKVTEGGKVCVMDLELEGVLALKRSHLKPRYIFITVPSLDVLKRRLEGRLRSLGRYTDSGTRPTTGTATIPLDEDPHESATPVALAAALEPLDSVNTGEVPRFSHSRRESVSAILARDPLPTAFATNDTGKVAGDNENINESEVLGNLNGGQDEELANDVHRWLAKASRVENYAELQDFFDLKIVNDDPERAYQELKAFCLEAYFSSYSEDD
ncbi:hypothetical protein HDU76_005994 [Blyttiomyces sp. JEL0837]|nr:hypothetical protein HDU76_005994 [Blyttiomyces sp. JEL0837]